MSSTIPPFVNPAGSGDNRKALRYNDTTGQMDLALPLWADDTESALRTELGLGTIATQAASNVAITGGTITGITDLAVADGGTGASGAAQARTNLDAQRRAWIDVREYGVVGDGITNDTTAFQACLDLLVGTGGVLYLHDSLTIRIQFALQIHDKVRIVSDGATFTSTSNIHLFTNPAKENINSFEIDGVTFIGNVDEPTSGLPLRNRTSTPGINHAVRLLGKLWDPLEGDLKSVRLTRCKFINLPTLPFIFYGGDDVRVTDCWARNTMDPGFVGCERVKFTGNVVENSADNGVSISRTTKYANVSDNVIIRPAHDGIWLTGFDTSPGPNDITCNGNVIVQAGWNGISCSEAPKRIAIVGNTIDGTQYGTSDEPLNGPGSGVLIQGFPSGSPASPTDYAEDVTVNGNVFRNIARNGVTLSNVRRVVIVGNLFDTFGSQFLSDGVTAIASTNQDHGNGVALVSPGTAEDVQVHSNKFIDTRGTPYGNYAITAGLRASTRFAEGLNQVHNLRNPANESLVLGMAADNDNLPRLIINGSAGTARAVGFATGGSIRWHFRAGTGAESGSNVGSDFEIVRRSDAGGFLGTPIAINRSSGLTTFTSVAGISINGINIRTGTGSPETVVTAPAGSLFLRTNGGAGTTFYVKESGTGNTGWVSYGDSRSTFSDAAYTVLVTDRYVAQVGTLVASRAVTLPAASAYPNGRELTIADESGSVTGTNTLVVTAAGADTINGAATAVIDAAYGYRRLRSDGTSKWTVVGSA